MKRFLGLFFLVGILLVCLSAYAQVDKSAVDLGEVVVTPLKTESSGKYQQIDTTSIDYSQINDKAASTAVEDLAFSPGVDVIGGGRLAGASESISIRGALARHTAYMFEGIKVYDPSNTSAYYVPGDFLSSGLQKVEVARMPLSSLYGSSPVAGAINFLVKKPQGAPYISFQEMLGSHYTYEEILETGGKKGDLSYMVNFDHLNSKWISQARAKNNNPETDPYYNNNLTSSLNYKIPDNWEFGWAAKVINSKTALDADDNYDGIPEDDLDSYAWGNETINSVYLKKIFNKYISYKIQAGGNSLYRRYRDDGSDQYMHSWYRGSTIQAGNSLEITPVEEYKTILGWDYTHEKASGYSYTYDYTWGYGYESLMNKKTNNTNGFFIEEIAKPIKQLQLDFSWRHDKYPKFKSHDTFKTGVSYDIFDKTTLYSSYAEGFKSPSLYQLYSSNGNANLKPEQSKSWEAGLKQKIIENVTASAAYFHSDYTNLIDFIYTNPIFYIGHYLNTSKAKTRGVEVKLEDKINEKLSLETGYTYVDGQEDFVGSDFVTIFSHSSIRVPKNKAYGKIKYTCGKFTGGFDLLYAGKRYDRIWVGMDDQFAVMKAYTLGNLSFDYQFNEKLNGFLKINNVFNKDYERIKGYGEEPISVYTGVKVTF